MNKNKHRKWIKTKNFLHLFQIKICNVPTWFCTKSVIFIFCVHRKLKIVNLTNENFLMFRFVHSLTSNHKRLVIFIQQLYIFQPTQQKIKKEFPSKKRKDFYCIKQNPFFSTKRVKKFFWDSQKISSFFEYLINFVFIPKI